MLKMATKVMIKGYNTNTNTNNSSHNYDKYD